MSARCKNRVSRNRSLNLYLLARRDAAAPVEHLATRASYDQTLQIAGFRCEEDVQMSRDLGAKGKLFFCLSGDGPLVATCGLGSLGAIAKEIRMAEMMIGRRLAPKSEALKDPAINMKSLLV